MATRDLIIVGRGPTALSVATEARRAGVADVLLLVPGHETLPTNGPGRFGLSVSYGFVLDRTKELEDSVVVESSENSYRARVAVIVEAAPPGHLDIPIEDSMLERVHGTVEGFEPGDKDVLVVGQDDGAVEDVIELVLRRARVVVAFGGSVDKLSPVAAETLTELEHDREITVLWESSPDAVSEIDGHPMVHFDDRRTPDLAFDEVVVRSTTPKSPDFESPNGRTGSRLYIVNPSTPSGHRLAPGHIARTVLSDHPTLATIQRSTARAWPSSQLAPRLRAEHYNATITHFDHSHEDLWVIRVRADRPDTVHLPGQYATLGLGYWEPRADDADESLSEERRTKLIRRSYSISGRVFDDVGYLWNPRDHDEIEFYIVHVRPDGDRTPSLTPRLALKNVGDRMYLGPKIAGRYTLAPINDPTLDVVFLATGTGEAPHNAMIPELLRKGHMGTIVSAVTIRYLRDLGYVDTHRQLEKRYPNYRYIVLPTREPDHEKRYIQDLIVSGELEELLPGRLSPDSTHVYMCGNPKMIGLPEWEDDIPTFPQEVGVTGLLYDRGFSLDRRGHPGNVHYEEYW